MSQVLWPKSLSDLQLMHGLPVVGNCSNTVFGSPARIVRTTKLTGIAHLGGGVFVCQCGVHNMRLITFARHLGYGGIAYLASVPGTIGGAVIMNAGLGRADPASCIGTRVQYVTVYNGRNVFEFKRSMLDFGYRHSLFHQVDYTLLTVCLRLDRQEPHVVTRNIVSRIERCREREDHTAPNCGTLFSSWSKPQAYMGYREGDLQLSAKTPNWLLNLGHGTLEQFKRLTESVGRGATLEVKVIE